LKWRKILNLRKVWKRKNSFSNSSSV